VIDGRYRIVSHVAAGATSDVSVGIDEHLDREVAVKVLRGETADRRRFNAEAEVLAALDHPNLVHLYDAIDGDDIAVLVMEFIAGPSLAEVLRDGPLPEDRVARLGAEVASCLAYLHRRGVVHRDVKPANLLIGPDGHARLADFGIARLVDATRLTATGQSIGTPSYMSPEQLTGGAVGPPTDIYALGLVLLEARTGRRAFSGQGHEAVAARLARGPDIRVDELGRGWARLLAAMTAREPARRPTAAAVAAALAGGSLDATAPTRVLPAGAPPPRRARWAVAGLAVLVAGVVTAVVASLAGSAPQRRPAPAAPPATAAVSGAGVTTAPVATAPSSSVAPPTSGGPHEIGPPAPGPHAAKPRPHGHGGRPHG